jgi:hypothetical protein
MELATPEQQEKILKLVEQGLDEGGLGIGINAGYAPGYGRKEYFALAEMAAEQDVATYTHVRYASNVEPQSSFEAVQELIGNAAITGAHMHLCHINSTSLKDIESIMGMVDDAFENDVNITVGAYPWGAASTVIGAAMFSGEGWQARMGSTASSFQLGTERMTASVSPIGDRTVCQAARTAMSTMPGLGLRRSRAMFSGTAGVPLLSMSASAPKKSMMALPSTAAWWILVTSA